MTLTQTVLRQNLNYDPGTGVFTRISGNSRYRGKEAGCLDAQGYVKVGVKGRQYLAHRLAYLYVFGSWPKNQVDHINGDRTDNRINNLRNATRQENSHNIKTANRNSTTKCLGVSWDRVNRKYVARIRAGGKYRNLGRFTNVVDAAAAYFAAKLVVHPFYAPEVP